MMKMLVLILSISFYSPMTIATDTPAKPIICVVYNTSENGMPTLDEYPKRCNIFHVGQFNFDYEEGKPCNYMGEDNMNAITTLVNANKIVYTCVGFFADDDWPTVLNVQDEDAYKTNVFEPLINFLKKYKISGITINFGDTYDAGTECSDQKISSFVDSIKKEISNIKVGLSVRGYRCMDFSNKKLFDYTITNEKLDYYMIDLSWLNICIPYIVEIGMNPIRSTGPDIISYETVRLALDSSDIDKSKLYAAVQVKVGFPYIGETYPYGVFTSYSMYCSSTNTVNSSKWCVDPSQTFYDQGIEVKKYYQGLALKLLELDDVDESCGCRKFPVTNMIIDGWNNDPFTSCSKIDACQIK